MSQITFMFGNRLPRKMKKQILGNRMSKNRLRKLLGQVKILSHAKTMYGEAEIIPHAFCPKCGCTNFRGTGNMTTYPEHWEDFYCLRCDNTVARIDNSPFIHALECNDFSID